ncbi:proline dehydrogenase family protein [Nocardioides sp.]|uniref:proline dehydrogenase family protein n=1 Tax=Nocardioides sp. TaxID=35761 RepID=UPI001A2CF48F|nr:proline dehydrogenase family protein [Nocardioides sp.]MBJ7358659.1 proline dehydrogenase family protein [Nocardioides sp.]
MGLDRTLLFKLATSQAWERAVRALPPTEALARRAAATYLAGDSAQDALAVADRLHTQGVSASIDRFGELEVDPRQIDAVVGEYRRLANAVAGHTWLSVDLTHLGLDLDPAACADRLAEIATALRPGQRLQVGAEDAARTDAVLHCVTSVAVSHAPRLGATIQANLLRSGDDVARLVDAGLHVRLVKGAYVESRHVAHPYGPATDVAFLRLAHDLARRAADFSIASHDDVMCEAVLEALGPVPMEQLLGVRPERLSRFVARGVPVRVYVPYGPSWFRYWMRRWAESRGAG